MTRFALIDVDLDVEPVFESPSPEPFKKSPLDLLHEQMRDEPQRVLITPFVLANLFALVEARGAHVLRMYINEYDYTGIRRFGRDILDIETRADSIRQGVQGTVYGAEIRVSDQIPIGHAFLVGSDESPRDLIAGWLPEVSDLIRIQADLSTTVNWAPGDGS